MSHVNSLQKEISRVQNPVKKTSPDFSLIFSVLENEIIRGTNMKRCRQMLSQEKVWKSVDAEKQIQWARLAQMAGEFDTALQVLKHVTQVQPQVVEAWTELIDLLIILDRKNDADKILTLSKPYIGNTGSAAYETRPRSDNGAHLETDELDTTGKPFETLRHHQDVLDHYLKMFSGREDCFARQWVNKSEGKQGYVPVHRRMERQDAEEHLSGRKTYGIYLLKSDSTVSVGVIDVDLVQKFRSETIKTEDKRLIFREREYLFNRIKELSEKMGLNPLAEFSGGKGFHFWFFFNPPIQAGLVKKVLEHIALPMSKDVSAFNLEIFPKQEHLTGKGLGNLVKLPLGVHRLTGKRSFFMECKDHSNQAQLNYLLSIRPANREKFPLSISKTEQAHIVIHPVLKQFASEYPDLYELETRCPPLAQIMAVCRAGKPMAIREEKILFQTIGFLPTAKKMMHYLMAFLPDYNPHLVDFKLSRIRGTPLGCKRIHGLLNYTGDLCRFDKDKEYIHPLLHLNWNSETGKKAERIENLSSAIENLKTAIHQMERFI